MRHCIVRVDMYVCMYVSASAIVKCLCGNGMCALRKDWVSSVSGKISIQRSGSLFYVYMFPIMRYTSAKIFSPVSRVGDPESLSKSIFFQSCSIHCRAYASSVSFYPWPRLSFNNPRQLHELFPEHHFYSSPCKAIPNTAFPQP